jgi:UDPglucose--hexose-1-phosphate uridylyltransferase
MSERRYDPTSDTWVTFASHRQDRTFLPAAAECPLCPTSPGGPETEIPRSAFEIAVFDNRFPSLSPDATAGPASPGDPYRRAAGHGRCEVVVYSDAHDGSLATLPLDRTRLLVDVWADRYDVLAAEPGVRYVMAFENKGDVVGVTLDHPHGQVYAYPDIPPRVAARLTAARSHFTRTGRCVHCDVLHKEVADGNRVVTRTSDVLAFVPFASRFPYEVVIAPIGHCMRLTDASAGLRDQLAEVLHKVLAGYDQLFDRSLPYVLAVHQRPVGPGDWDDIAHVHIEIAPPHRTADKLKYLAGSELAAGAFITDVLPEPAAHTLRTALALEGSP